MPASLRLAVVAAEPSGDRLGAGVVRELTRRFGQIELRGIGGPELEAFGLNSLCDIHDLSMMGVEDLFKKLPRALAVRRRLYRQLVEDPPDVFLGVDSPDFNLGLEKRLRRASVPVVHLVSPTVWAWRGYRIHKIRKAVDRMLVLFPFEEKFFQDRGVPATCVGHPAAREMALLTRRSARRQLGMEETFTWVALLPGSRESEIRGLAEIFVETAKRLAEGRPQIRFILPFASDRIRRAFLDRVSLDPIAHQVRLIDGEARSALAASDVALLASGTAALEASLVGCPMVVAYRVSRFSFWLARMLANTDLVSMPNHLLPRPMIPEFLQNDATAKNLADALRVYLDQPEHAGRIRDALGDIRSQLSLDTNAMVSDVLSRFATPKNA